VIALASVALIALLVSGATLSQILPGLFLSQDENRAFVNAEATGLLIQDQATTRFASDPDALLTPELRDTELLLPVAVQAANTLAQATVTITNPDGTSVTASPDADTDAKLRSQGLRPDPEVRDQSARGRIKLPTVPANSITLTITVSKPYTTRLATLDSVRGTLFFSGLIALLVSLVVGVLAARRMTTPLARLRRAASRLSHGELDERAPRTEIVEIDDLSQQFNVMADRLSESLRMLEADRDRLREFVADVSHELRTPIAALRAFTELQRGSAPTCSTCRGSTRGSSPWTSARATCETRSAQSSRPTTSSQSSAGCH